MSKVALITGGSGQDGSYLIELLSSRGYKIQAHAPAPGPSAAENLTPPITWHFGDLTIEGVVEELLTSTKPDEIYNLAAMSTPSLSWDDPYQTTLINALLPVRICDWLLQNRPSCRLFQASSSEIFGEVTHEILDERTLICPKSPYGMSKAFSQQILGAYRTKHGLHVSCGILFNHESPLRPLRFVSQKIAHAAAALSLGITETRELDERGQPIVHHGKLSLGNISTRRDFGFAGDIVRAMHLIVNHDTADDYVVGTGENKSIAEFCDCAFKTVGLDWNKYVHVASDLVRPTEARFIKANPRKLINNTGWRPEMSFDGLVKLMVQERINVLEKSTCKRA